MVCKCVKASLCSSLFRSNSSISTKSFSEDFVEVDSVIPEDPTNKIGFETNLEYFSETMPIEMDFDRTVVEYKNIMFERNGHRIKAKLKEFWELDNGERIVFM